MINPVRSRLPVRGSQTGRTRQSQSNSVKSSTKKIMDDSIPQAEATKSVSASNGIKVIVIGMDRKVFEEGSSVRKRLFSQRELFAELHVIVFARQSHELCAEQHGNLWLYPPNSLARWLYGRDAVARARGVARQRGMTNADSVITAQDPFECALAGYLTSKRTTLPLHVQIHTDYVTPYFSQLSWLNRARVFIADYIIPRATGIRVVSERVAGSVRARIKKNVPIMLLPVFSEHARKWAAKPLRRFKKEETDSCLVLMPSRFAPEKDFPTAIDAFDKARRLGSFIGLIIVGEGSEKEKIQSDIRARGLSRIIKMELWIQDLSSLYRVSDIVLSTSRFEGYGLVLLEAAIHGQPVVTTDVGIARELVLPPFERFICPVGDSVYIAARLKELSSDAKLRRAYGSALRTQAKKLIIPEAEYWKRYQADLERCTVHP